MTLTKEELAYGQQKNREHIWKQAQEDRKEFKLAHGDSSQLDKMDVAWVDYRYMELCEIAKITPW